jgi:polar amino acid transport system substrate-binding protein
MKRTIPILMLGLTALFTQAVEVSMAFGEKIPPFCFPQTDSGIEVEIIREALAFRGHVLKPLYFPLIRVPVAFRSGQVDGAMTDLGEDLSRYGANHGNPAVFYDHVFITLKDRRLVIKKPEDLKGLSVLSFPGGLKRYPQWLEGVQAAGLYREENDQRLQVLTLQKGRYDVVLSDRNIFKYFTLQYKRETGTEPVPVDEHPFTTVNPQEYRPIFRDKSIRDDFNAGLEQLKKSGRYQAIFDKYLKE